jgi:hypothetical protein
MNGQSVILTGAASRAAAKRIIDAAPMNAVCNVHLPKRSKDQNSKMWAILSDISRAKPLGIHETPDGWKALAMHACGHEVAFMQGLDGRPFPIGFRSSKLDKQQMGDLIEWLYSFGSEHNVKWTEERQHDDC